MAAHINLYFHRLQINLFLLRYEFKELVTL